MTVLVNGLVDTEYSAGQSLPDAPKATHSARPKETGLRKYVTVNETIDNIPLHWQNHNVRKNSNPPNVPSKWFHDKGEGLLPYTITTSSPSCHPSRSRAMTQREESNLQTFPLDYKWSRRGVRKQIGNAFPPAFTKLLFASLKEHLLREDGLKTR